MSQIEGLGHLASQREDLLPKSDSRVAVACETGEDESFFVGTREGFARLALALLRVASSAPTETMELEAGLRVQWSTETHGTQDPLATIAVAAECLVASDQERARVLRFFDS